MLTQDLVRPASASELRIPDDDFNPQQRVWLARGLVALCQWRLEQILHNCSPLDLPLSNFLKEQIASEEESADSLKRLNWSLHRGADAEFRSSECDQLLMKFLPSAFSRSGEGLMDREAALHFVEILETERQSFFSRILKDLPRDAAGDRLRAEADRCGERLRLVRTIVLPPPKSREPLAIPPSAEGRRAGSSDRRSWVLALSGQVNSLRELHRVSPRGELGRPVTLELMTELTRVADDAGRSDEVLAKRFVREFAALQRKGTRSLEDILGMARVGLAWLMSGQTRRSVVKNGPAEKAGG